MKKIQNEPTTPLQQRWLDLTRRQLPAAAASHGWPIRLDHCFMRVCLDHAVGARWDTVVSRPALHNLTQRQLARAVHLAEQLLAQPELLAHWNQQSLGWRGKLRQPGRSVVDPSAQMNEPGGRE